MGINPCCSKENSGLNRGAWTVQEDMILREYINTHGCIGCWRSLSSKAGLKRSGKSCRMRWLNYLRPDIKRGNISSDEEELIIRLHRLLGNRWSLIAGRLPGQTDNEIKNYWNTHLSKKISVITEFNSKRGSSPSAIGDQSIAKCKAIRAATTSMVNNCPDEIGMSLKASSTVAKMDSSKSLWQLVLEDSDMRTVYDSACSTFPTPIDLPDFPSSEQFAGNNVDHADSYSDIFSDSSGDLNLIWSPLESPVDMRVGGSGLASCLRKLKKSTRSSGAMSLRLKEM